MPQEGMKARIEKKHLGATMGCGVARNNRIDIVTDSFKHF